MSNVSQSTGFYKRIDLFSTELRNGFLFVPITALISLTLLSGFLYRIIDLQGALVNGNQQAFYQVLVPSLDRLQESVDNLEFILNADDVNITIDLGDIDKTTKSILSSVNSGNSFIETLFTSDDGWGQSIEGILREIQESTSSLQQDAETIRTTLEQLAETINGKQQETLEAILEALQGEAFKAKVIEAIETTEFSMEASTLEMTALEADALETADVILDACVSVLGEGPIECVGGEFLEFAIEGMAVEGVTAQIVNLVASAELRHPYIMQKGKTIKQ